MLVLALVALHLLLGAMCLVIARGEHKSAAMRWWGWGLLLYSAGLLATISAAFGVPRPLANTGGNAMVALSSVLCVRGVLWHTPRRLNARWVGLALGAIGVALLAGNFTGYQTFLVNVIGPTAIAVVLFLLAAFVIAREGPRDARGACQALAAMLLLAVITWIARIVAVVMAMEGSGAAERVDLVMSLFAIAQMVNGVAATLTLVWIDVRLMQAELARVAHSDALTGLLNRRAVRLRFAEEAGRAKRHARRFAMAVFDIDNFKLVNDRHGHAVGDRVLKAVADAFSAAKRGEDVLARIGGEEFLVLLAEQSLEGADEAAERLRVAVAHARVAVPGGEAAVTVSGGVALFPDDGADWDHLFAAADGRLYAAKREGRDRVEAGVRAL
jgi:diguanylate cyclase (GGDEF)-like protein